MSDTDGTVVGQDAAEIAEGLGALAGRLAGRTVLVTGATGMVGRSVVEALLAVAARVDPPVHVLGLARSEDKARRALADPLANPNFELVVADVAEPAAFVERPVDFIVHAASPATPDFFRSDPVGVIRANTLGTFAVLESARAHGAHLSFISTMEVYGEIPRSDPGDTVVLTESDAGIVNSLDLRSAYPESKRLAETLCVAYAAQYGVHSDIVRLSHTYGPGMAIDDARVQAEFIRKALAGEQIVLKSDGSMTRTYTYIADAAAAVLRAGLDRPPPARRRHGPHDQAPPRAVRVSSRR
jgi:UDP-glucuronate decarboxylase